MGVAAAGFLRQQFGARGLAQRFLSSPNKPGVLVKIGRGFYVTSAGFITLAWYTAYRNQRVPPGSKKVVIPGINTDPVAYGPSRDNKDPSGISPGSDFTEAAQGTPYGGGPTVTPKPYKGAHKGHEAYNPDWYNARLHIASQIANRFQTRITSGWRDAAYNSAIPGASPTSLHIDGLAFDFVGTVANMRRQQAWAEKSGMFQEILYHNAGTGLHLHLAFLAGNPASFNLKSGG